MRRIYLYLLLVSLIAASCSITKYVPEGDALYTGATLKIDSTPLHGKDKKELQTMLKGLIRPKPNKTFLGIRFKLMAYSLAGNPKKVNSIAGWLKNKVGEPPVLLSQVNLDRNILVLDNTLDNTGYFNAQVTGDTTVKGKMASAHYHIQTGARYFIQSVYFDSSKTILQQRINEDTIATLLKAGNPFDLGVIKDERVRIDGRLKEKGFYFFDPDFLIIRADTTIGHHKVNLYVRVKPNTPRQSVTPYTINDIYIFPNYGNNQVDTAKSDMVYHDGYYLLDRRKQFKPRIFEDAIQFQTGELYNRTDHNATLSRLINMGLFRFVKNRLEVVPNIDSAKLNSYYYLTTLPKQSLRGEINASTKSNNLTGSAISLGWRKRNTFRGGELLSIDASGGFEIQFGGQQKGYNTYRGGLEAKLSFPRFVVPFTWNSPGGFVPKTEASIGYDILTKNKLYTLHSFSTSYGFTWKSTPFNEHKLNPFVVTYVQPASVSQEYIDSIYNNPSLAKSIERQFIIGSNYNYNYSQIKDNIFVNGIYFNGNLDLSGNLIGLLTGADIRNDKGVKILDAYFSQYVRVEGDFRYYMKLSRYKVWVNRIFVGGSLPWGNSFSLPFVKQFFAGGNNGLRGFRSRSVGPGTYQQPNYNGFLPDQSGDMKLEINTELRGKLFSIVHGAIFMDAGNVWLFQENPKDSINYKPGGGFTKDFINQLAVDAGVGLRFDISFLVLRLDLGIPLRKPYLPEGQRWVLNQIDFGSSTWRKNNLIFNLGIGYPF